MTIRELSSALSSTQVQLVNMSLFKHSGSAISPLSRMAALFMYSIPQASISGGGLPGLAPPCGTHVHFEGGSYFLFFSVLFYSVRRARTHAPYCSVLFGACKTIFFSRALQNRTHFIIFFGGGHSNCMRFECTHFVIA